jgi:transposase
MQGKKSFKQKLFYDVSLETLVPQDHIIRKLDKVLDLTFIYEETKNFYSHEGKPSIDPVVLFKLHILNYFFGIESERKLFREIQVNLAYRWYIGYDLDEKIPDHSVMTKARYRFSEIFFERLFKKILEKCKESGLISGKYLFMDSSLIKANASKDSFRHELKDADDYLNSLESVDNQGKQFTGKHFDGKFSPKKMGSRRKRDRKSDKYKSKTDPDAVIITRPGKGTFSAYKAHLCVDRKNRVITAIEGTKAFVDDMAMVHPLYSTTIFALSKKAEVVIADSHYGGIESLKYLQDLKTQTCIYPRKSHSKKDKFRNEEFKIVNNDEVICPSGSRTKVKVKNAHSNFRVVYKMPKKLCDSCHLKSKCTDDKNGRTISFYKGKYFDEAATLVNSTKGKKLLRARQIIVEGVIGEAKTNHLLRRCRYRRLKNFAIQLYMTASVINLKRLLKNVDNKTTITAKKVLNFISNIYKINKFLKIRTYGA